MSGRVINSVDPHGLATIPLDDPPSDSSGIDFAFEEIGRTTLIDGPVTRNDFSGGAGLESLNAHTTVLPPGVRVPPAANEQSVLHALAEMTPRERERFLESLQSSNEILAERERLDELACDKIPAEPTTGFMASQIMAIIPALRGGRLNASTTPRNVKVFRVEGAPNTRILVSERGKVTVQGDQTLFLNFGSKARAEEFLANRLQQKLPGATVKHFEVPRSVLDDLRNSAVPESVARQFPNRPIIADPTKAADQFGLRPEQIEALRRQIIQGSGREGF